MARIVQVRVPEGCSRVRGLNGPLFDLVPLPADVVNLLLEGTLVHRRIPTAHVIETGVEELVGWTVHAVGPDGELSEVAVCGGAMLSRGSALASVRRALETAPPPSADPEQLLVDLRRFVEGAAVQAGFTAWMATLRDGLQDRARGRFWGGGGFLGRDCGAWIQALSKPECEAALALLEGLVEEDPGEIEGRFEAQAFDQRREGLLPKFRVSRADGRDQAGGDRAGADYFVLDLTYDPHAAAAVRAYAMSCEGDYPRLAAELLQRVDVEVSG